MSVQDAKSSLKMSPTLNFQSHWRPAGRNFGAPKNIGGLCFQVLGSLFSRHPQIPSPKTTRSLSRNHKRKEGLPLIIQATRIQLCQSVSGSAIFNEPARLRTIHQNLKFKTIELCDFKMDLIKW